MDEEKEPDAPEFADWDKLRKFLRGEVQQEVRFAIGSLTADIKAHDTRLAVLDASVKNIETAVSAGRWEVANITGMLTGFIGTKDVTGKFDVAINAIKVTAERANVLSHAVRHELETLNLTRYRDEGIREGRDSVQEKHAGWVKWIAGVIGTSGVGTWLVKHFKH